MSAWRSILQEADAIPPAVMCCQTPRSTDRSPRSIGCKDTQNVFLRGALSVILVALVTGCAPAPLPREGILSLDIVIEGPGLPISPLLFGVNLGHYDQALVDGSAPRSRVVDRLRGGGLSLLKYPGGLAADRYRWEAPTNDPADLDTAAFLALCRATGSQPVITVNSQAEPELAAAWVRYSNRGPGPPVRYWEFGDEAWGAWAPGHTDPANYVARFRATHRAMKAVASSIRLAANVSLHPSHAGTWNRPVITGLNDILEAVSFTFYPQEPGQESEGSLRESPQRFRDWMAALRQQVSAILGSKANEVVFLLAGYNSVTWEPGPQTLDDAQLLWLSEMMGALVESGVDLAAYWTLLSEASPRGGDYGLIQHSPRFSPRPAYHVFQAFRHLQGGRWWRVPTRIPALGLQAMESADGQFYLAITNWEESSHVVDLQMRRDGRVFQVGEVWRITGHGIQSIFQRSGESPLRIPRRSVVFVHLVSA